MTEITLGLLDLLLRVVTISLVIASPILIMIGLMYVYDRYKKVKETETKEAERIIIKNNEAIVKTTTSIKVLEDQFKNLEYSVLKLKEQKRELEIELGHIEEPEEEIEEEKINYLAMTVNELHDIARELKIRGFSRMKKDKLVEVLESRTISEQ